MIRSSVLILTQDGEQFFFGNDLKLKCQWLHQQVKLLFVISEMTVYPLVVFCLKLIIKNYVGS